MLSQRWPASVFLTLKAILIDSGSMNDVPLVSGVRQTELSELEILHVAPCGHVVRVAGFQLVVQALHQLILCSGCDYLHASLYTRVFTRAAKKAILPACNFRVSVGE